MIANITSGRSTRHLITYLYGPGRANEHTDPHLVASWDGFAPDPGRDPDVRAAKQQLTQALDLRVNQARQKGRDTKQHVWHCSVRAAPEDRTLSDEEWADIARRVVAATGIAPEGDPDGCRWVAVRHADDHIHIAATTVRGDLRNEKHWNDFLTADRELEAVEKDYSLHRIARGDRTAAQRPTRAEQEKARRTGRSQTARERLRGTVRTTVAAASSQEEFISLLDANDDVLVEVQRFPSGDVRGYKVALASDTNAAGEPVWFSGSKLAPDLSYPKIHERLTAIDKPAPHRQANPWHQATATLERIPRRLDQGDDDASQAHLAALGETLDALTLIAPKDLRPGLHQSATAFERATRSRIRPDHDKTRALRSAVRTILRQPAPKDGAALAMLLDAALLAVIAAARWHEKRHHQQQAIAARQAAAPLRDVYEQAAATPLAALAERKPPHTTTARHADLIRQSLPGHADRIINSPAWEALTTALTDAQTVGHDPGRLLQQAADQRTLDDAHSPAKVLVWRIHRMSQRPAPSPRARAAQARTTTRPRSTHQVEAPREATPHTAAHRPGAQRRR
ncbi:relaxase/mobilization nuclease domain-containing protein [Streptomyces sp. NPDC007083]|uniref:relaxase/mobilization nuclease domain-containing protein n=1 Tax=Streptomyces sp. NPDC007083 TaxID=3156913 RepID=UPI00340119D2